MRIINASLKVAISIFTAWIFVSFAYQEMIPLEDIFRGIRLFFSSFVMTSSFTFPALFLAYSSSKVAVFSKLDISSMGIFFSELPIVLTATTLQILLWLWIFGITSRHDIFLDTIYSIIPSFLTFFAVAFFQFYVKMKPVTFRIMRSEFVRTMRSIGMDDKRLVKKLSKNVDFEFAPTLSYMGPFLIGESLVLENVYNFRGIGYEMVKSLKEFKGDNVISLIFYTTVIVVIISEWAEMKMIWRESR